MKRILVLALFAALVQGALFAQSQVPYGNNPAAGQYAQVNGIRMYYEIYGEGPTLVLLHGNGGSIASRNREIPFFAKKYKVIAIDSRCHGKSGCSTGDLNYEQMAADVNALLSQLGEDSYLIWGHSDGGILGLLLGIHYPDKVARLMVTGANLQPDTTAVYPQLVELVRQYPMAPDTMMRKHLKLMADHPHIGFDELKKISAPVLVMTGDRDAIREEHTVKIFQALPNAQLCILPGTTHFVAKDKPTLFFQIASDFFEKPFQKPSTVEIMQQAAGQMFGQPEKKN